MIEIIISAIILFVLLAVAYKYGLRYIENKRKEVKRYNVRAKERYIQERVKRKTEQDDKTSSGTEDEGELKEQRGIQSTNDNNRGSETSDSEREERDTEEGWEEFE